VTKSTPVIVTSPPKKLAEPKPVSVKSSTKKVTESSNKYSDNYESNYEEDFNDEWSTVKN